MMIKMSDFFYKHKFRVLYTYLLFTPVALAQQIILPFEFQQGTMNGTFDAVIDVRTQSEWDSGHVPNATHIESLQLMTFPPFPEILEEGSCNSESSTIVVYCRSGARAGAAIQKLLDAGYEGTLYNGQGVSQWEDAGYELVDTESINPKCSSVSEPSSSFSPSPSSQSPLLQGVSIILTFHMFSV